MIRIFNKRVISEDMLPVKYPQLDDYAVLGVYQSQGAEAANVAFEKFKVDHDAALAKNRDNLQGAMKWMNQCAMWHGFTHFMSGDAIVQNIQHQDWCPAPYWYNFHTHNVENH